VWDSVIQIMGEPISQASVIKFLQGMTEKDILEEERRAGKGGYHGGILSEIYWVGVQAVPCYALHKKAAKRVTE